MPQASAPPANSSKGAIFNAYPDSLGGSLHEALKLLRRSEFKGAFSQFYLLPTFFNSDLDRGFSIIDYGLNQGLVSDQDLQALKLMGLNLKLDLVLNHLSVNSPQFQDLLHNGPASTYKDFFIDWNEFWQGLGQYSPEGYIVPAEEYLRPLFMRKPELPLLKVLFPDGSKRYFWNTFYQKVSYVKLLPRDLAFLKDHSGEEARDLAVRINQAIEAGENWLPLISDLETGVREKLSKLIFTKQRYLGQLDLNARSEIVWDFYEKSLARLKAYGAKLVRLDAFAYLHKEPGRVNFFNRPETWHYLGRIKELAAEFGLSVLPEIHAEYGSGLHEELAERGYPFYDFFFPGLVIDAIESGCSDNLNRWANEIVQKGFSTVNMLGCHDGIPLLDLKGGTDSKGREREGLLSDQRIDALIDIITSRGGRVKDLFGPDGKKISYYQVNTTFLSALGEDEQKLLLARAIQLFMPGRPQIWYLDLFGGKNDYAAVEKGSVSGHKEINRANLSGAQVEKALQKKVVSDQLKLIRLRNIFPAFAGHFYTATKTSQILHFCWENQGWRAELEADLLKRSFSVECCSPQGKSELYLFP